MPGEMNGITLGRQLKASQDAGDFTAMFVLQEEAKSYPMGDVWDYFCETNGVPSSRF